MKEKIPINPDILKWARKTARLQLSEVASKMGKYVDVDSVGSWEKGDSAPTYIQLEKLSYQIYKRPLALFFFPNPPEEETPKQSFRTLPEREIEMMSSRMHYLLRQARVMQINLAELNEGVNRVERNIIHDLKFHPDTTVTTMASKVREYLGIDLTLQFRWKKFDDTFKEWRTCLEKHGVFIFKDAFKDKAFSGFCLYDKHFPIIYINNSKSDTRQIFSIFHELAHLLLGTGGVDTKIEDYIDLLKGDDRKIEILCNRFAGEFLVPNSDFDKRISNININEQSIHVLAKKYKVSREVILRKLLDRKLIDREYYSQKVEQWSVESKNKPSKKKGGDYYATKSVYLGKSYIELAFKRYHQKKISIDQLAGYLDIKVKYIPGMEPALSRKGNAV